jgi:hypothetical protein
LNIFPLLADSAQSGWFGKMSPASIQVGAMTRLLKRETLEEVSAEIGSESKIFVRETILQPFSNSWGNAGMGMHGECWTVNISECHSAAGVSFLSDILEIGDLPARYFLSAKACAGILRRAGLRGKELPEALARALKAVVGSEQISISTED